MGKSEGNSTLGRPRHIWEDNTYIDGCFGSGMWSYKTGSNWLRIGTGGGHF